MALLVGGPSDNRTIIDAMNRAARAYAYALRHLDVSALESAYTNAALDYYSSRVATLTGQGSYEDNVLLSTTLYGVSEGTNGTVTVTTEETWRFARFSASGVQQQCLIATYSEYYELVQIESVWLVAINEFDELGTSQC
jgi:hypothetical protein